MIYDMLLVVDCVDSSDETLCSCKSRISEDKICDGEYLWVAFRLMK